MKTLPKLLAISLLGLVLFVNVSCDGDAAFNSMELAPLDTTGSLKAAADFPVGVGINADLMLNNSTYASTVRNQFDEVTFEYSMKQAPIVQADGSFDYSSAGNLLQSSGEAGVDVYGHTLIWHQNNNGDYLRSLVGSGGASAPNLILNGGFEGGSGDSFDNWAVYNSEDATISAGSGEDEVHGGERSLKIVNTADHDGGQWRVQIASDPIPTTAGIDYKVSFWIRAENDGGSGRLSTQPTAQYQGDFNTSTVWIPISWTFTAQDPETRILFDMGLKANTYYIDDVKVIDTTQIPDEDESHARDSTAVSNFMKEYIAETVEHFKGDVTGWDVVNEPLQDGTGDIRTNPSPSSPTEGDIFYWAQYLGESYIANAFRYADSADPEVPLYINDYNLESDAAKLEAFVQLVNDLKADDVPIDGVGTQMHVNLNTPYSGIDRAFKQLASTGLKVKVSELDVRMNPDDRAGFEPTPLMLSYQQVMYNYVVWSYMQNVPADQRAGITVWNLTDESSWIVRVNGKTDYPTLYDKDYNKKPAYSGFLRGLKGLKPASDDAE